MCRRKKNTFTLKVQLFFFFFGDVEISSFTSYKHSLTTEFLPISNNLPLVWKIYTRFLCVTLKVLCFDTELYNRCPYHYLMSKKNNKGRIHTWYIYTSIQWTQTCTLYILKLNSNVFTILFNNHNNSLINSSNKIS